MSYASFTQSFPDFIKSFPQKLFQPTGIAVMSSVGIHALLAVTLPYLPIASQEKPQPLRNVKLVQLTPAEQSRLPQLSPPSLSPLPNQLQSLYPLPAYPSTPLPSLSSSRDSYLYNLPPISPLPPASNGSSSSRTSQSSNKQSQSPKKQQPARPSITVAQGNEPIVIAPPSRKSILHGREFVRDLSALTTGLAPATPLPPPPNFNQTTGQSPSFSPTPMGDAPGRTTQAAAPAPSPTNSTDNSNSIVYDPKNRKTAERLGQIFTDSELESLKTLPPIPGNCPPKACAVGLQHEVVVKVNVDDKGNIISDSLNVFLSSDKDGAFDNAALSTVRGSRLPATGKAQVYLVPVQFKDDTRVPATSGSPTPPAERPSTEKPPASPERPSPEKPPASPERPNAEKPPASPERPSAEKLPASPERPNAEKPPASPERPNAEKPPASPERPSAEKLPASPERPSAEKLPASPEG